ncbi:MAG: hypothetical protein ACYTF1_11475 [Planctomycetota bacterium]|jgi:hypothetical protein
MANFFHTTYLFISFLTIIYCHSCVTHSNELHTVLFHSFKDGKADRLRPYLADHRYYRYGDTFTLNKGPSAGIEWEKNISWKLESSIEKIHKYGKAIGFDWSEAILEKIGTGGLEDEIWPLKTIELEDLYLLTLCIKSQDTMMTIFCDVRHGEKGLKLLGECAATTLNAEERGKLNLWSPGDDIEIDRKMGKLVVQKKVSFDYMEVVNKGGSSHIIYFEAMMHLPDAFDRNKIDKIMFKPWGSVQLGDEVTLIETGVNTLIFKGKCGLVGLDMPACIPIELKFRTIDIPELFNRNKFVVDLDFLFKGERVFTKIDDNKRIYRSPQIEIRKLPLTYPITTSVPKVTITYTDGIATDFSVREIKASYNTSPKNNKESDIK